MAQKLNIDIVARDKSKQALNGVQKSLGRLKQSIFNLQNAFIGLGAGLVIRNLVNTGKNLENLRVRLKFLLKDTNEGAKAFDNMTKFASKVPFSLEEIQAGAGILATVTDNADDLQKMLEITGNVASVTGLDFRTAGEQIQRSFSAGIGAADLFREKGVRNMLGFQAGATVSIEETTAAFEKVFGRGGRFGKATDELANTFEGTLSMIGDKIFNFKKVLLEAGFFEELKKQFGDLDEFLENNSKKIDDIATSVGKNLANAVVGAVNLGKDLIPFLTAIASPGTPVGADWSVAVKLTNIYADTGKLPNMNPETGAGWTRRPAINTQLLFTQSYIDKFGLPKFLEFLSTQTTIKEINTLRKDLGFKPIAGAMGKQVFGAEMFGPKVGPFMANLMGVSDRNVPDIWFTRGFNRKAGNMFIVTKEGDKSIAGQPRNLKERQIMDNYISEIATKVNLNNRDTQAVLWYFEQGLYTKLGVNSEPKSYADSTRKIFGQENDVIDGGIPQSKERDISTAKQGEGQ